MAREVTYGTLSQSGETLNVPFQYIYKTVTNDVVMPVVGTYTDQYIKDATKNRCKTLEGKKDKNDDLTTDLPTLKTTFDNQTMDV